MHTGFGGDSLGTEVAWREQLDRFHGYLRKVLELRPTDRKALGVLAAAMAEESATSASIGRGDLAQRQRLEALQLVEQLMELFEEGEQQERVRYEKLRESLTR